MIPELLPDDHPLLAKELVPFDFSAPDAKVFAQALSNTLIEAMVTYSGIGLAANQVGLEDRAFAIELSTGERLTMFNPLVTWVSPDTVKMSEGCLSFPALELTISRPKEIQIAYDDANGERKVLDLKGIDARCALHECDHLDGVVFTGRVSRLKLNMARKKMRKKA